jgi:hypothetical protein
MSDDSDPLEGADIGETRRVESTGEHSLWSSTAVDPFVGFDRDATNIEIESAEIVGEEGNERVEITYAADVTKTLRPHWRDGLDKEPDKSVGGVKSERASRVQRIGGLLLGAAVSIGVGVAVMRHVTGSLAGKTVTFGPQPSLMDIAPAVGTIGLLALFIMAAMPYLPSMAGRGGRI